MGLTLSKQLINLEKRLENTFKYLKSRVISGRKICVGKCRINREGTFSKRSLASPHSFPPVCTANPQAFVPPFHIKYNLPL